MERVRWAIVLRGPRSYSGIVGSGRIFSGANPAYSEQELAFQLKDTMAKVILVHPSLIDVATKAAAGVGLPKSRIFLFSDKGCTSIGAVRDWRHLLVSEAEGERYTWDDMRGTAAKTVATVNYSSGTTGLPKGVMITHANVIANVEQTIFIRDQEQPYDPSNRPEERWLGILPFYHAFGLRDSDNFSQAFHWLTDTQDNYMHVSWRPN